MTSLNRPVDENLLTTQVTFLAEFWGYWLERVWGFGLICSPSIADWSLNVATVSPQNWKFPHRKTEAHLGQNRSKSAMLLPSNLLKPFPHWKCQSLDSRLNISVPCLTPLWTMFKNSCAFGMEGLWTMLVIVDCDCVFDNNNEEDGDGETIAN